MFPYTIPNNSYLQKYAPKSVPEPPDLACGHFLEPGASREGVSPKDWNMKVSPFTIPKNTFLSPSREAGVALAVVKHPTNHTFLKSS